MVTQSQAIPWPRRPRPGLPLLAALPAASLALLLIGCAGGVKLRPIYDEGLQQAIDDGRAAVIEQADLSLTLRHSKLHLGQDDLAAIEIELYNASDRAVTIRVDDIVLIDHHGARHQPISPRTLEESSESGGLADHVCRPAGVIVDLSYPRRCYFADAGGWRRQRVHLGWGVGCCGSYAYWQMEDRRVQPEPGRPAGLLAELWREPIVRPGYQESGVVVFRHELVKRRVIRFELVVRPAEESPNGTTAPASGQAVAFEFIFYTT